MATSAHLPFRSYYTQFPDVVWQTSKSDDAPSEVLRLLVICRNLFKSILACSQLTEIIKAFPRPEPDRDVRAGDLIHSSPSISIQILFPVAHPLLPDPPLRRTHASPARQTIIYIAASTNETRPEDGSRDRVTWWSQRTWRQFVKRWRSIKISRDNSRFPVIGSDYNFGYWYIPLFTIFSRLILI